MPKYDSPSAAHAPTHGGYCPVGAVDNETADRRGCAPRGNGCDVHGPTDCDVDQREANGYPIDYCVAHGQDASACTTPATEPTMAECAERLGFASVEAMMFWVQVSA